MQIHGTSQIHGVHGIKGPYSSRTNGPRPNSSATAAGDQVEISAAGEAAAEAADTRDVRPDLVARVRNEIAAGTYETPEKLDAALESLLDDIA